MTLRELRKLAYSRGMLGVIIERAHVGGWIGHVVMGSAKGGYTDASNPRRDVVMRMLEVGLRGMPKVKP